MKRLSALLFALLLVMPSGVIMESKVDAQPIRIGVFEPLTGSMSEGGQMELAGIQVAHALMPEALGRPIELVLADSRSDTVHAITAARQLVDEGVDIVLGSWGSSLSIAAGPVFEAAQLPAIGTSCSNPAVTEGNRYYFRVCYLDDFQATILANYAKKSLKAESAAILYDVTSVYAIGLRNHFIDAFGAENVLAEAYFSEGDEDFTTQIESVMSLGPDVVFLPSSYTEPGLIMKQTRALGYDDILFLGVDTWETDALLDIGGKAVEGCFFPSFFDAYATPSEEGRAFLAKYKELHGSVPTGAVSALGYDAYLAAVKAIDAAGSTDGTAVRNALETLSFGGVTGKISFDANGDAIKNQAVIETVQGGSFIYIDTVILPDPE